jgi:hypothetical protein
MSFHSGRCPVPISDWSHVLVVQWSILRAVGCQPSVVMVATTRICLMFASATFWQGVHSSQPGLWEGTSALLHVWPWQCLEVKSYSWKHRIKRGVCPSRFLKLMSQVNAKSSVHRWNSCPQRYLRKCSSALLMTCSSCSKFSLPCSVSSCSRLLPAPGHPVLVTVLQFRCYSHVNDKFLSGCG